MSPKVIAILVIILLVIFGGMALTMKKATDKRRDRTASAASQSPVEFERSRPRYEHALRVGVLGVQQQAMLLRNEHGRNA